MPPRITGDILTEDSIEFAFHCAKTPGREPVGQVSKKQVREIAEQKMKDLNCDTVEAAMKMIEGSARSMGLTVTE